MDAARRVSTVRHNSAAEGRVRVSLHLEKQGLTDAEAQLLVAWYKVCVCVSVCLCLHACVRACIWRSKG